LKIFDDQALNNTPVTWRYPDSSATNRELIYTKYEVNTVDNPTFGISGNTQGTLHAFTCVWQGAAIAPIPPDINADFTAYAEMLNFIKTGMQANDEEGLKYLEKALGLD